MSGFTQIIIFLVVLFSFFFLFLTGGEEVYTHHILVYEKSLFSDSYNPQVYSSPDGVFFVNYEGVFFYENFNRIWVYNHSLENPVIVFSDGFLYVAEPFDYVFYIFNYEGLVSRNVYDYPIITFGAGTVVLSLGYGYRVLSANIEFTLTEAIPTVITSNEERIAVSFLNFDDSLFSSVAFYEPHLIGAMYFPRLVINIYLKDTKAIITFSDTILAVDTQTREIIWQKEKMLYANIEGKTAIYNRGVLTIIDTASGDILWELYEYIEYLTGYEYFVFLAGGIFVAITGEGEMLWRYTPLYEVISVYFSRDKVIFKTPLNLRIFTLKEV